MIRILAVYLTEYITSSIIMTNYSISTEIILGEVINQSIITSLPITIDINIE